MSFSMAAPPPPMPSPPLPTIALAPPPSNLTLSERRAQRQRQRATLPNPLPATLATPASLLFHSNVPSEATACHYVVDAPLSTVPLAGTGPAYTHHQLHHQEDDRASIFSLSHRGGTPAAVALPTLKSPLPPQYRHPSPAPSLASSISTAASTSTCASASSLASITSTSTSTSASSSTSGSSRRSKNNSVGHRRRKTITAADDPVLVIGRSDSATTVTPALLSPTSPPDSISISSKDTGRGRGRSFSRSVRKVASVFNLLKDDIVPIPSVPELPAGYRS